MHHQSASPTADRVRIYADSKRLKGIAISLRRVSIRERLRVMRADSKKAQNAKFRSAGGEPEADLALAGAELQRAGWSVRGSIGVSAESLVE
jgi:hypothetical protein